MKTLDQIAIEHQTDKATQFTRTYAKPHGYTPHYERVFGAMRFEPIKLLEIGVGGGESVQAWKEYFTSGLIYGVDIVKNTNPWNDTLSSGRIDRYRFSNGNQGDAAFWAAFIVEFGTDWDIVIDDGSHIGSDITTTFNCLWPNLKSSGLFCIEDLNEAPEIEVWLRSLLGPIHTGQTDIDSISFSKELAILRKR